MEFALCYTLRVLVPSSIRLRLFIVFGAVDAGAGYLMLFLAFLFSWSAWQAKAIVYQQLAGKAAATIHG
jgi:hypothetical protein